MISDENAKFKGLDSFSGCKNQSWRCLPNSPSCFSVGFPRQEYAGMVMGVISHNMWAYYIGCLHSWSLPKLITAFSKVHWVVLSNTSSFQVRWEAEKLQMRPLRAPFTHVWCSMRESHMINTSRSFCCGIRNLLQQGSISNWFPLMALLPFLF